MAVVVVMTVILLSTTATAEPAWYGNCSINNIGAHIGVCAISLTDNSPIPAWVGVKWFQFPPDDAKLFLAVGLSARSIRCTVRINSDLDSEEEIPYIYARYLNE